jgi:LysM repeat protein
MKPSRSFASDNNAGVHPEVLRAISASNQGHVVGYGDDPYTDSAVRQFKRHFGNDIEVFFVFNGTAANVLSLDALTRPYQAVLCSEMSHIYTDECGAPEKLTGCKLIPLAAPLGKLTVETVAENFAVPAKMVRSWNRLKGNSLAGRKVLYLHLPVTPGTGDTHVASTRSKSRKKTAVATATAPSGVVQHKVKQGETLYSIASSYNTTVAALQRYNRNTATLRPGMILVVRAAQ